MINIDLIRFQPELVKRGVILKNSEPKLVDRFLNLDQKWRKKIDIFNQLKSEQNLLNKELAKEKNEVNLARAQILKKRIIELAEELKELEEKRMEILLRIPNLPLEDVPVGKDENDNIVLKEVGRKPEFDFEPKDYLSLAEELDLIDVKRAAKVSGSRFGYLKRDLVLLEFAIINFVYDNLLSLGFIPVIPPVMIKSEMMKAMGYLDRHEDKEESYYLKSDDLYLVGTSEQSIGPMHAQEVFEEKELPKRYLAFSTCFRREAGSYGKDTRGIFRVHQFDKIEMFSFCHPQDSKSEHEFLLSVGENLVKKINLPYRVMKICTGDLGNVAAAKYDIEVWFPFEKRYRETHSFSNVTDYQARRLNIKFKSKLSKKLDFVHTLNGTAFALGRIMIALLENFQTKEGKVKIPEVLQFYLKKEVIG